jgi:hypothetical protein
LDQLSLGHFLPGSKQCLRFSAQEGLDRHPGILSVIRLTVKTSVAACAFTEFSSDDPSGGHLIGCG